MADLHIEIAAKLTVHEFLLEMMYANLAMNASDPLAYWDEFGRGLIERTQFRMHMPEGATVEDDDALAVQAEAVRMMQNFVRKTHKHIESEQGR